jgi:anti-sigma-K factor RskA
MSDRCEEVKELLPAYVLDSVSAEQRAFIEDHVDSCEDCLPILDELREVEQGLLHLPDPVEPPAYVKQRLLAAIAAELDQASWSERLFALPLLRATALAAFLLLIVTNLSLLNQTVTLQNRIERLSEEQEINQTALALSTYPNARIAEIDGDQVGGTFVFDPDIRLAVAYVWGLPSLPSDQIYQAWLISPDGARMNAGLVDADPEARFITFVVEGPSALSDFIGFGMTIEPSGGSDSPTGPRVLGVEF